MLDLGGGIYDTFFHMILDVIGAQNDILIVSTEFASSGHSKLPIY
jgi:hypothetical protein